MQLASRMFSSCVSVKQFSVSATLNLKAILNAGVLFTDKFGDCLDFPSYELSTNLAPPRHLRLKSFRWNLQSRLPVSDSSIEMWRGYDAGYGPPGYRDARYHRAQGPSPWIPVTMLAVIVLITALPYMRAPAYYHTAAVSRRYSSSISSGGRFPSSALWIPVLGVIALQFFATPWQHGFYNGSRGGLHGARPGLDARSGAYDYYRRSRSWWNPYYNPYNVHHQRGFVSTFMDYGGHYLLILLGITVFSIVGASSSQAVPPPLIPVPLAPFSWGFPWNLFF